VSTGMPFTNIYPDGPAGGAGTSTPAASANVNAQFPGMPAGASPVHNDIAVSAAGTVDLWAPPTNKRFVLASAFISSDTAMRVALVDGSDIQGSRIVDQYVAANGGSAPNLVPVPEPSSSPGQPLRLVTAGAGNVRVRVSGWLAD
jgi:hypothetical protein